MTLKEYRQKKGLTVRELTEELKEVDSRFTMATVSYMENGVVEPSDAVRRWLAAKSIEEENIPLSEAEDAVLRALVGHSYEDPVTRADLKYWCGLPDREARHAIEDLRARGYWIVNGVGGKGYYITFDRNELEQWLKTYTARARVISKNANAMRARVPEQVGIGEVV